MSRKIKFLAGFAAAISLFLISFAPTGVFFKPQIVHAAALTSVTVAANANNVDNLIGQSSAIWNFAINNVTALAALTHAVVITFPNMNQGNWILSGITATSTATGGDAITFATSSIPANQTNGLNRTFIIYNISNASSSLYSSACSPTRSQGILGAQRKLSRK